MDFFKEYSDLSNTPVYSKYNQSPAVKNIKKQSGSIKGANDDIDDLLSDLMEKQQIKKSRKNLNQPYSSQNLGFNHIESFTKTQQPIYNQNSQSDINYNFNNLTKGGNKGSRKSILDDLMSDDNQSYKSGVTGKRDKQDNNIFEKNNQQTNPIQPFQSGASQRTGMRPPLKKRADSRQPSLYNDQKDKNNDLFMFDQNQRVPNTPLIFRNQTIKQTEINQRNQATKVRFDFSNSKQKPKTYQKQLNEKPAQAPMPIIQQKVIQKIVHVKQDNKQLSNRHQQQIKLIKQSYERQINNLKENYQKIIKDEQQNRKKILKSYEQNLDLQKRKWQKLITSQNERIKSLYDWESKKKTQSYQLQINKLKGLIETITKVDSKGYNDRQNKSAKQQSQFLINIKLREIQRQKQKLENQKSLLQAKRRQFQSEQHDFQMYKRKQQQKINHQRKKLFQYQTEIRKKEVEIKKQFMTQKQSLAAQLVNAQLALNQARQNLKHQGQKLQVQKQLFNQQKQEYQKINNKILADLKERHRNVQKQKQELQNLQIQLYKKINTIQMMAVQKGIVSNSNQISLNGTLIKTYKHTEGVNRSISHYEDHQKENFRNRVNSQLNNKVNETKNRYVQMEKQLRTNTAIKQTMKTQQPKIHLQRYMEKLGKERLKLQKY